MVASDLGTHLYISITCIRLLTVPTFVNTFHNSMSTNYDDCNLFGIKNEAERYIYGSWLTLVVISSLLGDTTILVASIKYKAFRLHRTVVVFIQHIAVCDLFTATGMLLPVVLSLIYDSGGSNEVIKFIRFFIGYWVFSASPLLIGAMSVGKFLLVRYPLRARAWSKMKTHKLCAGLWILSLTVPVQHLLVDMDDVVFDCRTYMWNYRYSSEIWNTLMPITTVLAYLTPNIIIIIATILLLTSARRVAKRMQENLRWQGTMAVVITATIFTISFLPITVYFIAGPLLETDSQEPGPFFNRYYRVTEAVLFTNVMANFFTYGLTVASFREFIKTKLIKKLVPCLSIGNLSQLTPSQG